MPRAMYWYWFTPPFPLSDAKEKPGCPMPGAAAGAAMVCVPLLVTLSGAEAGGAERACWSVSNCLAARARAWLIASSCLGGEAFCCSAAAAACCF